MLGGDRPQTTAFDVEGAVTRPTWADERELRRSRVPNLRGRLLEGAMIGFVFWAGVMADRHNVLLTAVCVGLAATVQVIR